MSAANKTVRYSRFLLKQAVWHLRDVENIPEGFQRNMKINNPTDAVHLLGFLFKDLPQEQMIVAMLNRRGHVQAVDVATVGTLDASLAHPREIFRSAIACLASSIIIMHNHPSGNPAPSEEDIEFSLQIQRAGEIVGIPLMDSLIFADGEFTSLREEGAIS